MQKLTMSKGSDQRTLRMNLDDLPSDGSMVKFNSKKRIFIMKIILLIIKT
jgi:hypothetical protein